MHTTALNLEKAPSDPTQRLVALLLRNAVESLVGEALTAHESADRNRVGFPGQHALFIHAADVDLHRRMILGGDGSVCRRAAQTMHCQCDTHNVKSQS